MIQNFIFMKIKKFGNGLLIFTLAFLFLVSSPSTYAAGQGQRCATDNDCNTGTCANNACAGCDQILLICMPRSVEGADCILTSDCVEGLECGAGGICARPAQQNQPEQQAPATPPAGGAAAPPPAVQQLTNPLGAGADIPEIIARVIKAVLGLVGSIGLLMFIYGGFLWLTAGGSEERVKKGREVLTWAVIGLATIFTSYAILNFIISGLTRSAGQANEESGGRERRQPVRLEDFE